MKRSGRSKSPSRRNRARSRSPDLAAAMGALTLKHKLVGPKGTKKKRRTNVPHFRGMRVLGANEVVVQPFHNPSGMAALPPLAAALPEMAVLVPEPPVYPVRQEGESAADFRRRRAEFVARSYE